ncbi:MAG: TraR/DksA family transcriptional regulator [Planctomycetota bacterium]|nr:TraR/DksA family transcriptional regulator [Planctomycetota bacterium]
MESQPPRTPFTQADLEHFRTLLTERRARIFATVTELESEALTAGEQNTSVDHLADHGSDAQNQDVTLSLAESEREELYQIDRAILRLDDGTYGICEGTGEPIGRARLEAIPYTRYSVEYQRKIESGDVDVEHDAEADARGGAETSE